jgi:hypothetical protein
MTHPHDGRPYMVVLDRQEVVAMPRQASDFRQGVEAAATWLMSRSCRRYFSKYLADRIAKEMLLAVADDPEGTEARTVAQIVQYMRDRKYGHFVREIADSIEAGDWKRQ